MMDRRAFIILMGGTILAAPLAVRAQPATKIPRIGFLVGSLAASPHLHEAFLQGLRDLGYVEGRNLAVEYRDAEGKYDRLPALAVDLVVLKIDVIVVTNIPAAVAAKQATTTIPIVMTLVSDPVGSLVVNLARPGGNVTGLSLMHSELSRKRLELLKEVIPKVVGALMVMPDSVFFDQRNRIVDLAAKRRLPAMSSWREPVDAGGLMAYGASGPDIFRCAAEHIDKILKGRQGRRPAHRAAHKVRASHQPQDRQGVGPDDPANASAAGGSGAPVDMPDHRGVTLFDALWAFYRAHGIREVMGGEQRWSYNTN